jgi:glucokinase
MILAGDIGGTKTNLGLFSPAGQGVRLLRSATYQSAAFPGLSPVVTDFLAAAGPAAGEAAEAGGSGVRAACFGIAGPVIDNRVSTPNLPWTIDARQLAAETGIAAVLLINDLVATGAGIPLLRPEELAILQPGSSEPAANRALIAAGTGLGMALLPWSGGGWMVVPSEGGHADFAPRDEDEIGLLLAMRRRFGGHVSIERVLSGPGLVNTYEYLRDSGFAPEQATIRRRLESAEPAPVIAAAALAGECVLCGRALEMFTAVYGAVAGNLALTGTALGGVFLGGGIAPKILPALHAGGFVRAFLSKGRFASYLERVPVQVILNDQAALLGAARRAADLAARGSAS